MKINESIELFLDHCKFEKNLAEKTIDCYKIDLEQFLSFLNKGLIVEVENIHKDQIRKYIRHLHGFKPKTIKRKVASSKAFLNFLEFEDYIVVNPYRKVRVSIREPQQLPCVLTKIEVQRLFNHVHSDTQSLSETNLNFGIKLRDFAVLELLFATGIRVSELCELKLSNIDFEAKNILVIGKGKKERVMHVSNNESWKTIVNYYKKFKVNIDQSNSFFLTKQRKPLSSQSVRMMIKKYCKELKMEKKVTPHTFRHTFATLLLEQDVDIKYIQIFLGHSSITTTQIYTRVNREKQRAILTAKHPRHDFQVG